MAKVVIEIPGTFDINFKAKNIPDAIKKLIGLKTTPGRAGIPGNIKRFKGIARYKNQPVSREDWYVQ